MVPEKVADNKDDNDADENDGKVELAWSCGAASRMREPVNCEINVQNLKVLSGEIKQRSKQAQMVMVLWPSMYFLSFKGKPLWEVKKTGSSVLIELNLPVKFTKSCITAGSYSQSRNRVSAGGPGPPGSKEDKQSAPSKGGGSLEKEEERRTSRAWWRGTSMNRVSYFSGKKICN